MGANVLIFGGLQFAVDEIIWGLKFQSSQMCYLWSEILGRRDYFGGLIFLVSHCLTAQAIFLVSS